MVDSSFRVCAWLEFSVVLFQIFGVAALCLNRLMPESRWAGRTRVGFVFAMIGLGVAGALCGRHDSEFALFAGGTLTLLFIGMTMGGVTTETTATRRRLVGAKANLAG